MIKINLYQAFIKDSLAMLFHFVLLQMIDSMKIDSCSKVLKTFYIMKNEKNYQFLEYFQKNWINQKTALIPIDWW